VEVPFPEPGSNTERRCRATLARVVRDHVPGNTGDLLALAIDPKTPATSPMLEPTRYVTFGPCNRGTQPNSMRDIMIVADYRAALREQADAKDAELRACIDRITNPRPAENRTVKQIRAELQRIQNKKPSMKEAIGAVTAKRGLGRTAVQNILKAHERKKEEWLRRHPPPVDRATQ
jgi:hypothetical protein